MKRKCQIGDRYVGGDNPCFITFEAGPTHNGIDSAKNLVKAASDAGADAVKFQILDVDRLVSDRTQLFTYKYLDQTSGKLKEKSEPLYDILARRCLKKQEWAQIKRYSETLGIEFFSTIAFEDEIDFLIELGCKSVKIASADINYVQLLKKAARSGLNIQLDTGMSELNEIEQAIGVIEAEGNSNLLIHHCPSGYPAASEDINLSIIPTLVDRFAYPIAFSDHSPGADMDIAAVALGASMVEKTITLNRYTESVEHAMSLEPSELPGFVSRIRNLENAFGKPERLMTAEDKKRRQKLRRSAFLTSDAVAGTPLENVELEFRRPEIGIAPDDFEKVRTKKLATDLKAGASLNYNDIE